MNEREGGEKNIGKKREGEKDVVREREKRRSGEQGLRDRQIEVERDREREANRQNRIRIREKEKKRQQTGGKGDSPPRTPKKTRSLSLVKFIAAATSL